MAQVCPTVTAYEIGEFQRQLAVLRPFAKRIHIDMMDGDFAPTISPRLRDISLPPHLKTDIHLMYRRPMEALDDLIRLRPNMVIIHNEADVHHMHFAAELHKEGIKTGLALLQDTPVHYTEQILHSFDHVLIFSGNLGHHGGEANLALLDKVQEVHQIHPDAEIGWDGGINITNAAKLIEGGVDVLNVGGYVHRATNPKDAYATLETIVKHLS